MNDIASMRNTGPRRPAGFRSGVTGVATPTGLAAAETVGDFGVFFVEGKRRFYQEKKLRVEPFTTAFGDDMAITCL
jgi:hypothetical protein